MASSGKESRGRTMGRPGEWGSGAASPGGWGERARDRMGRPARAAMLCSFVPPQRRGLPWVSFPARDGIDSRSWRGKGRGRGRNGSQLRSGRPGGFLLGRVGEWVMRESGELITNTQHFVQGLAVWVSGAYLERFVQTAAELLLLQQVVYFLEF